MTKITEHLVVHKEGEEGTLLIERLTGKIITAIDLRPDWANGLAVALIQDRNTFYETRLGKESTAAKELIAADAVEFADLGWIGVNGDGDEMEVHADDEYRMNVVAKVTGLDRETGAYETATLAERELSRHTIGMTSAEAALLDDAVREGFQGTPERVEQAERATGGAGR